MGNRAVISFGPPAKADTIGIYLHWNGGRASVEAFLDAARTLKAANNSDYTAARVCQIICNWFGGVNSVGIGPVKNMDTNNGDNGVYIVNDNLEIIGREFFGGEEETDDEKTKKIYEEVVLVNESIFNKGSK